MHKIGISATDHFLIFLMAALMAAYTTHKL